MATPEQAAEQQLALAMAYSAAYTQQQQQDYTTTPTEEDTRHHREDSDNEDTEGRRRGGSFERSDLKRESSSRRYAPYNKEHRGRKSSGKTETRIFVSNFPYTVRWQDLKDHMKKVGDVAFCEIFEDEKGRSKGCGVVEFRDIEDAEKAISEYNGQDYLGRRLLVRHVLPEEEERKHRSKLRGTSAAQSQAQSVGFGGLPSLLNLANSPNLLQKGSNDPAACTVFVSNLDYKVNWQKLKDTFRSAGNVVRAEVMEDDDKKSKGMGTVQFESPLEAMNAVTVLHGKMLDGRALRVRMDRSAPQMQAPGQSAASGGLQGFTGQQNPAAANPLGSAAANNPVALLQLLQSLQGLTALAQLANLGQGATGASSSGASALGSADLTNASALSALGSLGALSGMMGNLGGASVGNISGSSQGMTPHGDSSGKQIFVRNLPWKYTWQDLKDKFRLAGKVTRADIMTETNGRSKGCGIVVFETNDDAQRAISMFNGSSFDGREIDVRIDRFG